MSSAKQVTDFQLSACQRCRTSKKRCDRAAPKCSHCTKGSFACIIVDPITARSYSRQYIHELEQKEKELLGISNARHVTARSLDTPEARDAPTVESTSASGEYVGESGGMSSYLRHILSNPDLGIQRAQLLGRGSAKPRMHEETLHANHIPPTLEEASDMIDNYFTRFHIHRTFLLRRDVVALFHRAYHPSEHTVVTPQDKFRLLMIFAISSITRYRMGMSSAHPYSYYLAALTWLDRLPLIGSAEAVVNMLLVARFGMYQHIRASLWDISCFCMRQCIELEYHLSPSHHILALQEQEQRRIFWECYILDRYSSSILGRPFAIADDDIEVDLPVVVGDEVLEVLTPETPLRVIQDATDQTNELSVFVFCIRLRLITSRIYSEFFCGSKASIRSGQSTPNHSLSSAGHVRLRLQHYLDQLDGWLATAPVFVTPRSLYEQAEWHAFLMEKDKLTLIRGCMTAISSGDGYASSELLALCMQSASRVIELFSTMLDKCQITWTRSYFQVVFMAGLSIVYCLSRDALLRRQSETNGIDPFTTLATCVKVLHSFQVEMPDVRIFSYVFEELAKQACKRCNVSWSTYTGPSTIADPNFPTMTPDSVGELSWASQLDGPDLDWLFTDNIMQDIEADVGEYAWGLAGDDWLNWDGRITGYDDAFR